MDSSFLETKSKVFHLFDSISDIKVPTYTESIEDEELDRRSSQRKKKSVRELFRTSGMARKIVSSIPDHALKNGIKFTDESRNKEILDTLKEYDFLQLVHKACINARLDGGCAIFINENGIGPEGQSEPLSKSPDVLCLTLFSKDELSVIKEEIDKDINSKDYKEPVYYEVKDIKGMKIHRSRLVIFDGDLLPPDEYRKDYWHASVLDGCGASVERYERVIDNIDKLVERFLVEVVELEYADTLADSDEGFEVLQKRVNRLYSDLYTKKRIFVGKDEKVHYMDVNIQGIPPSVDRVVNNVVAQTDLPRTILLNDSSGSAISNNGGADQEKYYDDVMSFQSNYLMPKMILIINAILSSKAGLEGKGEFEFVPLFQKTDKEKQEEEESKLEQETKLLDVMDRLKSYLSEDYVTKLWKKNTRLNVDG